MKVYLDDDLDANTLISLLRQVGHEVISPRAVGTRGAPDEQHLRYAASHALVLLTANAEDFLDLHRHWTAQGLTHYGILIVYRENNPVRDMSFQEIASAVTKLEKSRLQLTNALYNLNVWR